VERWCEQTPKNFIFDVKLNKVLSRHSATLRDIPPELRKMAKENTKGRIEPTEKLEEAVVKKFLQEISPFKEEKKLGALLLQLSPGFSPRSNELSELDHLISLFKNYKLAIEFRNKGWVSDSRLEELNEYLRNKKVTFVGVDAPDTEHFMAFPYLEMVTNPALAYLRCHGRNVEGYVKGRSVATRFNYQYPEEELREIAEKVEALAEQAQETHVVYNNNASDYAIKSAKRFQQIIQEPSLAQQK
jgi:uncharacterized protein YecE (DUF72 family)